MAPKLVTGLDCYNRLSKPGFGTTISNERGAALILAIAMLAILSILGSIALMASNTELKVTGNYQVAKETFMVADRAVEYATSRNILMTMGTEVNLVSDASGAHKAFIEAGGGGFLTEGIVRDLGPGDLPAKIAGAYGTDFGANFYQVSVTARQRPDVSGQTNNSAAVHVDTSIVRIFKNEDESIFITTGGGG